MSAPRLPWQYVVLAIVACAFFLGMFALIPATAADMRMSLLGLLVLAGQAAVARWIVGQVGDDLATKITKLEYRMVRLERAVNVSRETSVPVSRETKRNR